MSSSDPSKALFMQHFLKDLTRMLSRMAFHAADTHRATSEGAARKGRLKETCGLEPRINFFFFRLRNRQKLVRIRFENIRYVQRNIEARSCQRCRCGKETSITYSDVCDCSLSYPVRSAHVPCYILICGLPCCSVLFHIFSLTTRFSKKKKKLNMKRVFRFFLQLLSEKFFILRRTEWNMIMIVYWFSCKLPVIPVRF